MTDLSERTTKHFDPDNAEPWIEEPVLGATDGTAAIYVLRNLGEFDLSCLRIRLDDLDRIGQKWVVCGLASSCHSPTGMIRLGQPLVVRLDSGAYGLWIVNRDSGNLPLVKTQDLVEALSVFGRVVEFAESLIRCNDLGLDVAKEFGNPLKKDRSNEN